VVWRDLEEVGRVLEATDDAENSACTSSDASVEVRVERERGRRIGRFGRVRKKGEQGTEIRGERGKATMFVQCRIHSNR